MQNVSANFLCIKCGVLTFIECNYQCTYNYNMTDSCLIFGVTDEPLGDIYKFFVWYYLKRT